MGGLTWERPFGRAMELLEQADVDGIALDHILASTAVTAAARCGNPMAAKRYHSHIIKLGRRPNLAAYRGWTPM